MKRLQIAGLCLVVAFALSAMVGASVAEAGQYGQCVAKKKGKYSEGNCQTVDERKGLPKGKFEWAPGPSPTCVEHKKGGYLDPECKTLSERRGMPSHKGKFEKAPGPGYTSATGNATLAIAVCTASTAVGEVTGLKAGTETVTFTGCSSLGAKCTSAGQAEGTIQTYSLESTLIDHGEKGPGGHEPVSGEVWIAFAGTAASERYSSEFYCTGKGYFRTKGSISGVQTGDINVTSSTSTTTFASSAGEQDLITETSENGTEWSGGTSGGPNEFGAFGEFRTKEETVATNTAAAQTQIRD